MRLLFVIAACCCLVLVGAALALWWSIQRERAKSKPAPRPFAEAMRRAQNAPHPRMDLAAGIAVGSIGSQQVRDAVRRPASRTDVAVGPDLAPVKQEARAVVPRPQRKDWAYYNENNGDLSDPDLRRAPKGGLRPLGTVSLPESR